MLRKARNISIKLGINRPDSHTSQNSSSENDCTPVLINVDSASSQENSPMEDDHAQLSDSTQYDLSDRPMLTHCESAPVYNDDGNLELLLSMEVQERLDVQKEKEEEKKRQEKPPRPTRIRFDLPQKPPRSKPPTAVVYPKARPVRSFNEEDMCINQSRHSVFSKNTRPRRSGWRLFGDKDDEQKPVQQDLPIYIGSRVRLKMRPLPTFGYAKYIGPVEFASGEYIGVELDFGVGDCDGSVNGRFYFESEGKRGIFLQRREIEAVQQ